MRFVVLMWLKTLAEICHLIGAICLIPVVLGWLIEKLIEVLPRILR